MYFPESQWVSFCCSLQYTNTTRSDKLIKMFYMEGSNGILLRKNKMINKQHYGLKVGWLFWISRPFETVFQSISGRLPEREKEERNDRREKEMSKQPQPAPIASAVGPCSTLQISRTPQH